MDEDYKVIDNYLMIRMPAEVDHHQSIDISKRADRYIVSKQVGNVVFDFERTTFMDSSGVGVILGRYRKISCFPGLKILWNWLKSKLCSRRLCVCALSAIDSK